MDRPPVRPAEPGQHSREARIPTLPRRVAIDALLEVEKEKAFSSLTLDRTLSAYPTMPKDDKRLATALFYGVIEKRLALDHILKQFMQREPEDSVTYMILRLAALQMVYMTQIPDYAACGEAVAMTRYKGREALCSLVNAVTREISRRKDEIRWPEDPVENLAITSSTPEWLTRRIMEDKGDDYAKALLTYEPRERFSVVRVNRLLSNDEEVRAALIEAGLNVFPSPIPGAFRVNGGSPADTRAFHKGLFSVQGEASMLCAYAISPKGGDQILDACAAPGGKACMLAEMMRGAGRVQAMDLYPHRVKLIEAQAHRLRIDNVRPRVADASKLIDSLIDSQNAVLIDAPCSGLGVITGKPDIKYNLARDKMDALPALQLSILETCSQYVRRGGALVYSTCTVLPAENEDVVSSFLEKNSNFVLRGLAERLPTPYNSKVNDGFLSLSPHIDGMDGFFIARMERES